VFVDRIFKGARPADAHRTGDQPEDGQVSEHLVADGDAAAEVIE
jgi:hypothetical protein